MQGNALQAFGYLMRGAQMLSHRKLRPFVIIPLLINLLIFGSLVAYTLSTLNEYIEQFMGSIPEWLSFLRWVIWPVVGITISLVTGYLFTAVALLIASPFNSLLAEKAEEIITGEEVESLEGIGAALKDIPRSILRELQKFFYYLPLLLLVLVLSFVPAVNFLAPLMWFALGAWMMSIQYLDYPMDNHRLPFAEVKNAARARPVSSFGFGGGIALITGIPVLNFFIVPAAVVGATLYWCEEFRRPSRIR
ncbi:MAG: sulfate transporter CysZ [Gammaproteobacteria bacterium]|nr:MAG: sulfate transporter CysZ [Gammaproteobacteria bacterium]